MRISSRNILGIFFAVFATTSTAFAAPPKWQNEANAETCGESFPERLANFREGVVEQQQYMAEYNRTMPWFHEHCRWLSEREIAIRKLDDLASFVCDTKKGRPKRRDGEFALSHQSPADFATFIEFSQENRWCHDYDAAERVSLKLGQTEPAPVQARIVIEGMCWHVESAKCDKGRAALAATP